MSVQFKWGKLKFKVDNNVAHGIEAYAASLKAKADGSKSQKAYSEAETISFSITSSVLTGGRPMHDYNFLKSYVGQMGKVKVNEGTGQKLSGYRNGGAKFKLESVELSGCEMDNYGRILAAEIKLKFVEDTSKPKPGSKGKVNKYRKKVKKKIKGKW